MWPCGCCYVNNAIVMLDSELNVVVQQVQKSTFRVSSKCVPTGMTLPSLQCCDRSTAVPEICPSFIQFRPSWPRLDEWLPVVAVRVPSLFVVKANRDCQPEIVGCCRKQADAWKCFSVTPAVDACGCLTFHRLVCIACWFAC